MQPINAVDLVLNVLKGIVYCTTAVKERPVKIGTDFYFQKVISHLCIVPRVRVCSCLTLSVCCASVLTNDRRVTSARSGTCAKAAVKTVYSPLTGIEDPFATAV